MNQKQANTNDQHILFINSEDSFEKHKTSANGSLYPNLGLLTLMNSLDSKLEDNNIKLGYYDGALQGNKMLYEFIDNNPNSISMICASVLTSNYEESLRLVKRAKEKNTDMKVIFGNDHFSALYSEIMQNQPNIDFGFYGNDVVEGFTNLVLDLLKNDVKDPAMYPGLVYRKNGNIERNLEDPSEYHRLSLINYDLIDSFVPSIENYFTGQQDTYKFIRDKNLRSMVIDVARGCLKFKGNRNEYDISELTCDFCGIIKGSNPIVSNTAEKAWFILENAYNQGINYFYFISDDLPLTFWPMLKQMAENIPEWYSRLSKEEVPKAMGYSLSNVFDDSTVHRIDVMMDVLNFDHFFIGLDGFSDISLKAMNKGFKKTISKQLDYNLKACEVIQNKGGLITAGGVLTHLGITPEIMEENSSRIEQIVNANPKSFAALDFGVLCPIPGSLSFEYLKNPELAQRKADELGLRIDKPFLLDMTDKYKNQDSINMDELVEDFIYGCCPDIDMGLVREHENRIKILAEKHDIVLGGGV